MNVTVHPDSDPSNADWPKRTWDLHGIHSRAELERYLEGLGMTLDEWKTLPVYCHAMDSGRAPEWLRTL